MSDLTLIRLAVTYNDEVVMFYPVEGSWHIDNPSRCLIIGRGVPRTHVPLDQVRSFEIIRIGTETEQE